MNNNDLLRRLRYALNLGNASMLEMFRLADHEIKPSVLNGMLRKEEEEQFLPCSDQTMAAFLDGLIAFKRGKKDGAPRSLDPLNNNVILRKLRIALELREEDMLQIFKSVGFSLSRSELSAFFRGKGQPNYKECGDQLLRKFIQGLPLRKDAGSAGSGEKR